ncbi:carboxymuconolactone decarboxylase family protein [Nocardia sp. CA2R105]|uniref:carboxymuconolactone decarboxylase family protein n=1 Tax=Nocardia coffeae TaxID=2873381 RepID=UPI001CA66AF4|nr:carboxymuconolactone decarboxylase family protein [Nocardia coffeae]MBY8858663.1 carboxymuconolactone decarboxylase family protein [Nocardia coffeae]
MNEELWEKGLEVRREVAGRSYVDKALADADDFTMSMQRLVTEFCWGEIWTRPDLDRRSRSMLNIGMLAALGRLDELSGHIRGAVANGVTKAEVRECLLQVAVYAGMPAGMSGFKVARRVFEELESQTADVR